MSLKPKKAIKKSKNKKLLSVFDDIVGSPSDSEARLSNFCDEPSKKPLENAFNDSGSSNKFPIDDSKKNFLIKDTKKQITNEKLYSHFDQKKGCSSHLKEEATHSSQIDLKHKTCRSVMDNTFQSSSSGRVEDSMDAGSDYSSLPRISSGNTSVFSTSMVISETSCVGPTGRGKKLKKKRGSRKTLLESVHFDDILSGSDVDSKGKVDNKACIPINEEKTTLAEVFDCSSSSRAVENTTNVGTDEGLSPNNSSVFSSSSTTNDKSHDNTKHGDKKLKKKKKSAKRTLLGSVHFDDIASGSDVDANKKEVSDKFVPIECNVDEIETSESTEIRNYPNMDTNDMVENKTFDGTLASSHAVNQSEKLPWEGKVSEIVSEFEVASKNTNIVKREYEQFEFRVDPEMTFSKQTQKFVDACTQVETNDPSLLDDNMMDVSCQANLCKCPCNVGFFSSDSHFPRSLTVVPDSMKKIISSKGEVYNDEKKSSDVPYSDNCEQIRSDDVFMPCEPLFDSNIIRVLDSQDRFVTKDESLQVSMSQSSNSDTSQFSRNDKFSTVSQRLDESVEIWTTNYIKLSGAGDNDIQNVSLQVSLSEQMMEGVEDVEGTRDMDNSSRNDFDQKSSPEAELHSNEMKHQHDYENDIKLGQDISLQVSFNETQLKKSTELCQESDASVSCEKVERNSEDLSLHNVSLQVSLSSASSQMSSNVACKMKETENTPELPALSLSKSCIKDTSSMASLKKTFFGLSPDLPESPVDESKEKTSQPLQILYSSESSDDSLPIFLKKETDTRRKSGVVRKRVSMCMEMATSPENLQSPDRLNKTPNLSVISDINESNLEMDERYKTANQEDIDICIPDSPDVSDDENVPRNEIVPVSSSDDDFESFIKSIKSKKVENKTRKTVPSMDSFIVDDDDVSSEEDDDPFYHQQRLAKSVKEDVLLSTRKSKTLKAFVLSSDSSDESSQDDFVAQKPPTKTIQKLSDQLLELSIDKKTTSDTKFSTPKVLGNSNFKRPLPQTDGPIKRSSFLKSLSADTENSKRDPDAFRYVKQFSSLKMELTSKLFKLYNEKVFDNKLPVDMKIIWNERLRKSAGFCAYSRDSLGQKVARIELSMKVCDTAERLRDTLMHEMCHAYVWVEYGVNEGHGDRWKFIARKANLILQDLPPISRCHSYTINTKFIYKCTKCGYEIGRHSKSLDVDRKVCGYCKGKFELLSRSKTGANAGKAVPLTPRTPNQYALFVKEHYGELKRTNPKKSHKEVMELITAKYSLNKNKNNVNRLDYRSD